MRTALRAASGRLEGSGSPSPRLDAELLLAHALGIERAGLHAAPERALAPPEADAFEVLVERRAAREPVAYLVGVRGFRRIEVACDARALVPRPETELLVEAALRLPAGARVADVGTGTGAVALALKSERPDLDVVGIDVDEHALALARENAQALGLEIGLVCSDLLAGAAGPFDCVLANLPYVPAGAEVPPELAFEPPQALFAGEDGLDVIRRFAPQAAAAAPFAALEVGAGQARAVAEILSAAGFSRTEARPDLAGIERVVAAWR